MARNYFEDLEQMRARAEERAMVFAALRQRRARPTARGLLVATLQMLGVIR